MGKKLIVSVKHHQPWLRGQRLFDPMAELKVLGNLKVLKGSECITRAFRQQSINAAEAVVVVDELLEGLTHDS